MRARITCDNLLALHFFLAHNAHAKNEQRRGILSRAHRTRLSERLVRTRRKKRAEGVPARPDAALNEYQVCQNHENYISCIYTHHTTKANMPRIMHVYYTEHRHGRCKLRAGAAIIFGKQGEQSRPEEKATHVGRSKKGHQRYITPCDPVSRHNTIGHSHARAPLAYIPRSRFENLAHTYIRANQKLGRSNFIHIVSGGQVHSISRSSSSLCVGAPETRLDRSAHACACILFEL